MKSRPEPRFILTAVAMFFAAGVVPLGAQPTRTPPRADTPRLMVQVFGSADKVAGPEASDELRDRLIRAFPSRVLWIIDRKDIVAILEQSGYPTDEQLPPSDEAQLAKNQRADEYIRGRISKLADGNYRVDASLVLTRDNSLRQPLPSSTGNRPDRAAAGMVKAIQDARQQLDNEKDCMNFARDNKLDEAMKAADEGIAEYPGATLVRYCKINVLVRRKAPDSELLALAYEILAIDSVSKNALAIASDAEKRAGNAEAANTLLVRLLATDPTNAELAQNVVEALAASGDYTAAKEIVLRAVADNPGDIDLVSLQFKILTAAGDFKPAIRTGEEMVQMDTSRADATFYSRMVALYAADSQPQKAAEAGARATKKFPKDADLWQLYAQTLKNSGQVQQSIAAARQALEINPAIPNGWTQIAIAYNELNLPDSALGALRMAKSAGDDADGVGGFALNIGNRFYRAAAAEDPKNAASFRSALPYLHFADSTVMDAGTKTNAKFLIGVSSYYIAQTMAADLAASKSCADARIAQSAAIDAMVYTQAGGRAFPENAAAVLGAVNGITPYLEQSVKAYCK